MTHEAGIEAAVYAFQAAELDENNGVDDFVSEIIQAYLSASGMVLVPKTPTKEMLEMGASANAGPRTTVHPYIYYAMIMAAPNPFKSK